MCVLQGWAQTLCFGAVLLSCAGAAGGVLFVYYKGNIRSQIANCSAFKDPCVREGFAL